MRCSTTPTIAKSLKSSCRPISRPSSCSSARLLVEQAVLRPAESGGGGRIPCGERKSAGPLSAQGRCTRRSRARRRGVRGETRESVPLAILLSHVRHAGGRFRAQDPRFGKSAEAYLKRHPHG